jgi:hypothetical protein
MYGRAAITAAELLRQGTRSSPEAAWDRAISLETKSSESRKKSCPRGAFLELCAAGEIPGCKGQLSLLRGSNGEYAVRMLEAIRADKELLSDRERLWRAAVRGEKKRENGQIDVVISLWKEGIVQ